MQRREALKRTVLAAGTVTAAPSLLAILNSCQSTPRLNWQPVFLNESQAQFISKIVDVWLPATDTPGALDMKVDIFLDMVFARMFNEEAQKNALTEIDNINKNCRDSYGSDFINLSENDRNAVMQKAESESGSFNKGVWGTAVGNQEPVGFYRSLKSLAMWGYFSSEEIGKNVLNYDPVPGVYNGCIPLEEVGNLWSL